MCHIYNESCQVKPESQWCTGPGENQEAVGATRRAQLRDLIRMGVPACLAFGTPVRAQNSFQLVALLSNEDTIFDDFPGRDAPSLSGDTIAFIAVRKGSNNISIVRWQIGTHKLHALPPKTPRCQTATGGFSSLNDNPSIDGTDIAFHAFTGHPSRAVFAELEGELQRLS